MWTKDWCVNARGREPLVPHMCSFTISTSIEVFLLIVPGRIDYAYMGKILTRLALTVGMDARKALRVFVIHHFDLE
jgi:hypothetical protein